MVITREVVLGNLINECVDIGNAADLTAKQSKTDRERPDLEEVSRQASACVEQLGKLKTMFNIACKEAALDSLGSLREALKSCFDETWEDTRDQVGTMAMILTLFMETVEE